VIARLMGLTTLSPRELHERIVAGTVTVFDLNGEARWRECRVPGARPLDPHAFVAGDLPAELDAPLVFYCSNPLCRKAPNAARRALQLGFRDVRVMSAGISGWVGASLPTESGPAREA
jgi:rhodanese-related sulfurtransferase